MANSVALALPLLPALVALVGRVVYGIVMAAVLKRIDRS
jgi:hypothetical protein|tara:strand:- start:338 stop:454 length:117 start_codon:yes stop_codon:yes gene_type:complete